MARVTTVTKSMKDQTCGRCGTDLPKGSEYRWAKPGFRSRTRLIRCMEAACSFRQSELTTSKLAGVYAAQEDALESIEGAESVEDLQQILTDAAEAVREVAEEYREAAEAMGDAGAEMEEKADELEGWADELDDVPFDETAPEREDSEDNNDYEETLQMWTSEQVDMARDALDSMPV